MSPISFSPSTLLIHVSLKIGGGGRKKIKKCLKKNCLQFLILCFSNQKCSLCYQYHGKTTGPSASFLVSYELLQPVKKTLWDFVQNSKKLNIYLPSYNLCSMGLIQKEPRLKGQVSFQKIVFYNDISLHFYSGLLSRK